MCYTTHFNNLESKKMNPRKHPRTLNEAFPFGPEYACAIEKPRRSEIAADYLFAIVIGVIIGFGLISLFV